MFSVDERVGPSQSGALAAFWYDVGLVERLMYKNKNQHRHTLHFQRLQQVHRILSILRRSPAGVLRNVIADAGAAAEPRTLFMGRSRSNVAVANLLDQLVVAIKAAGGALGALLAQSFFMPFALTMFACLARIHGIASQALERTAHLRRSEVVGRDAPVTSARESNPPAFQVAPGFSVSVGAPPIVQPSSLTGPDADNSWQTARPQTDADPPLERWPPGFPIPSLAPAEAGTKDPGDRNLAGPIGIWPYSGDLEVLGDPDVSSRLVSEGTLAQAGTPGGVEAGFGVRAMAALTAVQGSAAPTRVTGSALVAVGAMLESVAVLQPVAQTSNLNVGRKSRAAAWLEELELGPGARKEDRSQSAFDSSEDAATQLLPGQKRSERTQAGAGSLRGADLTDLLLAGTDFDGFGGLGASEATRGPRRKKRRPD